MSGQLRKSTTMFLDTGQSPLSPKGNTDCSSPVRHICVIGALSSIKKLNEVAQKLDLPLMQSDTGDEYCHSKGVLFITDIFEGENFNNLRMSHRILGPEVFLQNIEVFGKITKKLSQPLYCLTLYQKKICLAGFEKLHLTYLKNLINFMGGSVRPAVRSDISYLVTNSENSEQYTKATEAGIPIMRVQWVIDLWARRDQSKVDLSDPTLKVLKVTELSTLHIAFNGFSTEETKNLELKARDLGASVVSVCCELCTHVVLNPDKVPLKSLPQESPDSPCHVVVLQWFNLLCRMKMVVSVGNYIYHRLENTRLRNSGSLKRRYSRPRSSNLSDSVSEPSSNQDSANPTDFNQRLVDAVEDGGIPSKTSRIHCEVQSSVPDKLQKTSLKSVDIPKTVSSVTSSKESEAKFEKMRKRRWFKCNELYETEKNYVDILRAINNLFSVPLEKMDIGDAEIKIIFAHLTTILEVHTKICTELELLITSWNDNCRLGDVFVKYSSELTKAYPPFINFMDILPDKIDKQCLNPEFHKLLKEAESNPVFQRQELKDLIVWPMQRIGRLILLLQGILHDTTEDHQDFKPLKKAIELVEICGRRVNEDKRITESVINRLELYYEIENCPRELLSTKRYFAGKYVVQDVQDKDGFYKKSDTLVLFLFKEVLEICKQKSTGLPWVNSQKKFLYKHVQLLFLNSIKHVVLVNSPKEHLKKFALVVHPSTGSAYRSIYFVQGDVDMTEVVHKFSLLVARCNMKSIEEIYKSMSFKEVLDYLKSSKLQEPVLKTETAVSECTTGEPTQTEVSQKTPERLSSRLNDFRTPEKVAMSPSKTYSLSSSQKKSKLRRAFSSFLTPIQNIVSPHPPTGLKSGFSTSSVNALGLPSFSTVESTTPTLRKKLKSNSFGAKRL